MTKTKASQAVRSYLSTIVIASLAMTAGQSWAQALGEFFDVNSGTKNKTYRMVIVAGTATIIAALCALYFSEHDTEEDDPDDPEEDKREKEVVQVLEG